MPENNEIENAAARERRTQRLTVIAALGGALIGSLTALTGSFLVHGEAKASRQNAVAERQGADQERRADIRRQAYVDLASMTNKFIIEANNLSIISLNPNQTDEARTKLFDDDYTPAFTDLQRAIETVRLVTTEDGRRDLDEIVVAYILLGKLVNGAYGAGPENTPDVPGAHAAIRSATEQQLASLQKFMARAVKESL
ncbi:hypothetical protein [Streptomyces sp. NPDC057939]|uniref:hypothetical protein n=1 Tax=Streptomyces sp. NPDC057939 TaxID=3346284 RepID=UPI0036E76958